MIYLAPFFTGAFLCNAIPHLANGLSGSPFPTPFAKPRGKGDSSPLLNFLWGFFNLAASLALFTAHPVALALTADCLAMAAGAVVLGAYLSLHFGKVKRDKAAK